ncbi:hypothetical protein GCM10011415_02320 [Salipiger pallidus]|uniref:Peptidase S24-like n=2 Tax=Salipiger pallidus TaxID=1775170 RepID=A0A8J2ZG51_9RHOB|nr:hypothetical protein GCM10011415_02320 [Salipiger pallidus]
MSVEEVTSSTPAGLSRLRPTFPLMGRIRNGGSVEWLSNHEKLQAPGVLCPPGLALDKLEALEVADTSCEPVFSKGDILLYDKSTSSGAPAEMFGHRCVVKDEKGAISIRQIKPTETAGRVNLIALTPNALHELDKAVEWTSRIRLHWPAELVRIKTRTGVQAVKSDEANQEPSPKSDSA